jgi:signal transduction histidine kinase/ActR/RegA family two-component response regulator
MKAFLDETGEWIRTGPNIIANRSRYIINDFRQDPGYAERPYVAGYPHMVSYLEVPLVSPLGYLLGSYCVVDNKLRDYDNDETIKVMNEIASAIMEHLELRRMKQSRHRSEQLIGGLSGFIGYESPMQMTRTMALPEVTESSNDIEMAQAITPDEGEGQANTELVGLPRPPLATDPVSSSSIETSVSAASLPDQAPNGTPLSTPRDDEDGDPMQQQEASIPTSDLEKPASHPLELQSNDSTNLADIKSTFFRAAATIRWAMNMDGLMFLDAVPSAYASRSDEVSLESPKDVSQEEIAGPHCNVIVQSTVDQAGDPVLEASQTRLPETTLQRFIRRFPQGHIFSADEFGPIDECYGPGKPFRSGRLADSRRLHLKNDVRTLFRVLPDAKYIVFLPLWHFQRECWYTAALGWVSDPTRAIEAADIRLVSAFGNSVMAEVSRLEALAASRAKSNFISSISHELRSPLHGILASSELLREGIADPSLLSTLDMLDSCGTTLLDTFNNLLDHAIAVNTGKSFKAQAADLQPTNLAELVEDVVEAVKISHLSESAFNSSMPRSRVTYSTSLSGPGRDLPDRPLLVTVNIGRRSTWNLPIDVGAWKRIVMNIFSNALKYTSSGHIEVALNAVRRQDITGSLCEHICFSVKDTGRGMTSDFLKFQLFTPFSQENNNSPGMGLGLSIVQQLAAGLGGTVDVKSSVEKGTRIDVSIPIAEDPLGAPISLQPLPATGDDLYTHARQVLMALTVCLITPDAYRALLGSGPEITNEMRSRSYIIEQGLRTNAGGNFGMKIILGTAKSPLPDADLYVVDGDNLTEELCAGLSSVIPSQHSLRSPVVLLCSGAGSPSCSKRELLRNHRIHLHHPIGPRKLASAFCLALKPDSQSSLHPSLVQGMYSAAPSMRDAAPYLVELSRDVQEPEAIHTNTNLTSHALELGRSSEEPPASSSTISPKTRHLLLVDDNPINITLLTTVVRKLNHTYVAACHGLEAVQHYKAAMEMNRPFDLVFMDISMPVMDGFEATRQIRQLEHDAGAKRCRIVSLTGLGSELSRKEAFASGSDLFLTKPVKLDKVRMLLDENAEEQMTSMTGNTA